MADWNDILSGKDDRPDNEELMDYINNNLSEEDKHALEQKALDSDFINDALEGLDTIKRKEYLEQYVLQLNKNLQQQLANKRQRKHKRRLKDNPWIVIAILILLAICILGYVLIHMHIIGRP